MQKSDKSELWKEKCTRIVHLDAQIDNGPSVDEPLCTGVRIVLFHQHTYTHLDLDNRRHMNDLWGRCSHWDFEPGPLSLEFGALLLDYYNAS